MTKEKTEVKEDETSTQETSPDSQEENKKNEGDSNIKGDDVKKPEESSKKAEEKEPKKEPQIDYAAELEKAQKTIEKANKKIVHLEKGKKDEDEDEDYLEDDDKRIQKIVDKSVDRYILSQREEDIDRIATSMANSDAERELILFHYNNSINKTGFRRIDIGQDMQKAKALANIRTVESENRELKESLSSKNSTSNTGVGSNHSAPQEPEEEPQLSEEDKKFLRSRGIDPKTYKSSKE
ncbi:hypothetical protein GF319_15480 [Candidatus Bathyarchaeota archaeon]|nr:hypothetical protein [Candidatus Bathyarchaeota archaeon]